jgi:hypothetical protein
MENGSPALTEKDLKMLQRAQGIDSVAVRKQITEARR